MWTSRIQSFAGRTMIACALGALVSGCATSPMDLLPDSARTMIQAEMRLSANLNPDAAPMSVQRMLENARGVAETGTKDSAITSTTNQNMKTGGRSVADMLKQARINVSQKPSRSSEELSVTLGTAGIGLNNADINTYTELLSALSPGIVYQAEIRVGSAGDAKARAVVFKTYADINKLRQRTKTLKHHLSASMDAGLMAGLVNVRIVRKGSNNDA